MRYFQKIRQFGQIISFLFCKLFWLMRGFFSLFLSVPKWFFLKIPSIQPKNHENHERKSPKSRKNHGVFSLDFLLIDPLTFFIAFFCDNFFKNTEMSPYFFTKLLSQKFFVKYTWNSLVKISDLLDCLARKI